MTKQLCLIGGGPNGIGLARELIEGGIDFDLFEAESDFGGVWNSEGKSSRVYPSLHLISPKFNTQIPGYPMPDDYPVYPNHKQMLAYMRSYARDFGVYEKATFDTLVTKVEPDGEEWIVETSSGEKNRYSVVVVCNGQQRVPRYPDPAYPGEFTGEIVHSIEYKSPELFKGKRVLVVGAGNSGCDIAVDAVHHGEHVFHSTRRGYYYQPKFVAGKPTPQWMMELGQKFGTKEETLAYIKQVYKLAGYDGTDYGLKEPEYPLDAAHPIMNSQILHYIGHGDITPKDDVSKFDGKFVEFVDGSREEIDLVIYATGYDRDFPFLDPGLLQWKNGIPDLFMHFAPRNFNNLLFFGFVNAAAGLGDGFRMQGQFLLEYITAKNENRSGYHKFLKMKQDETPDLGQGYYIDSHRHNWEVDLWKFLRYIRNFRDVLDER